MAKSGLAKTAELARVAECLQTGALEDAAAFVATVELVKAAGLAAGLAGAAPVEVEVE